MIARFQFVCNRYIKKGQKLKKHVYQQVRACKKVSYAVTKKPLSIKKQSKFARFANLYPVQYIHTKKEFNLEKNMHNTSGQRSARPKYYS